MKTNLILSTIAVCLLIFSACQQPAGGSIDLTKAKAEIQALENDWAAALNAKDVDALMAMYKDDAVSMPDQEPMMVGKEAIRKQQELDFASMPEGMNFTFETLDVYGTENTLTEFGKSTYKDASGNVIGSGKYAVVWEKQNGKYLCAREIYNNDTPPSPSEVRSLHLLDFPKDLSEAEWLSVINAMNAVFAKEGYPSARYNLYKSTDDKDKDYRYFFEGVWPSEAVYNELRENPAIKAEYEKSQAQYDKIKGIEMYRRMSRVQ